MNRKQGFFQPLFIVFSCLFFGFVTESMPGLGSTIAKQKKKPGRITLIPNKPTVYLEIKSTNPTSNDRSKIRLALCNNTKWPIYYDIIPGSSNTSDLPILYDVEVEKRNQSSYEVFLPEIGDMLSTESLPPGKSVTFLVLRKHLFEGSRIRVRFNYKWEEIPGLGVISGTEPCHWVYFTYNTLPDSLKQ